ncbi:hypothetical protein DFH29DRAFT_1006760 [Suillus ampliporus]|nr:hypothetical protein DFH29DRAFT_1006760 [Suillus ampliporus]
MLRNVAQEGKIEMVEVEKHEPWEEYEWLNFSACSSVQGASSDNASLLTSSLRVFASLRVFVYASVCSRVKPVYTSLFTPLLSSEFVLFIFIGVSAMARTKMTAKKSNGGSAPRVLLKASRTRVSGGQGQGKKASSTTKGTLPVGGGDLEKSFVHNEFCIICRDGAERSEENTLFMCALCPRVVCKMCLQLPPDMHTKVLQEDISFRCICCHIKMEQSGAYFGFYNANGLPLLDRFLAINGALEVSEQAEISAAPVLFIHLILVGFHPAASPFEFAHTFLKPYFADRSCQYLEIYYDIATDAKLAPYRTQVRQMIKGLGKSFTWERVVIGVSTHTDNQFGDPFTGYGDDDPKGYVSTPVNDFLEILLQPWQGIIDQAEESYLWMLCCGSVVTNSESFLGLQDAVLRHNLTATMAFNAPRFQPSFASHLLLAFTEKVLVGRCPIRLAFKDMLAQSCDLGRHSDVCMGSFAVPSMGQPPAYPMQWMWLG